VRAAAVAQPTSGERGTEKATRRTAGVRRSLYNEKLKREAEEG
jgi:hypothetical protein